MSVSKLRPSITKENPSVRRRSVSKPDEALAVETKQKI